MARTRYGTDRGLSARMLGTMFGIGLLYVILAAVLIAVGINAWFVLLISGAMLFGQWWFSDSLAMSSMRARVVTPEQAPQLHAIVDRVCAMADMSKPRVGIADSDVPNAFATGRSQKRAVIVVTTGLLKRLDQEELEGVLAHELSHVAHRDVTVMAVASFTAIVAGFMARSVMWNSMGRNRDQNTRERRRLLPVVHPHAGSLALPRAGRRSWRRPADREAVRPGPRAAEDLR